MSSSVEEILGETTKFEKEYEWLQASELYEQALDMVDEEDHFRKGEIQEKIGCCLRRAAFQADSMEEFKERMCQAIEAYEKAHGFYEMLADERGAPWMFRCRAISRELSHWLASDPSEKRKLLNECLDLEEKALTAFWDMEKKLEYGRTYNEFPMVSWHSVHREWDRDVQRGILEKTIAWGEKAVAAFSEVGDPFETIKTRLVLDRDLFRFHFQFIADPEKQEQYRFKVIERLREAIELFEKVGDLYLAGRSHYWLGRILEAGEEGIQHFKKSIEHSEETHDNYLKAQALDYLAYGNYWVAHGTEDPDDRRRIAEEAMEFYDRAHHLYSIMSYQVLGMGKTRAPTPGGYAEYYLDNAEWETDREKKLELLEKSERAGLKALKVAESSDIPTSICRMTHILSRTLAARARLEPDIDTKRSLLEKALKHREISLEIWEQNSPFYYWNTAVWYNLLANIKTEQAFIQTDTDSRRSLLEDAMSSMEKSLQNFNNMIPYYEKRGARHQFASLTKYQDDAAKTLVHLYEETKDQSHLRRAVEIWRDEIDTAEKGEMISRIAESFWNIAKTQDVLRKHSEAAESFQRASESYEKATEKIPQLNEFYRDYAHYMKAWSEIEKAKSHHAEKHYGEAKEHYEKAAELHESTERWSYLTTNYQAWARLDEAEDLSRRDQTEEARDLFQQAATLFAKAHESIRTKVSTIEDVEERQIADDLVKASDVREEYCLGRAALEEARILDRQGDHSTSSKRYNQANVRFQNVIDTMKLESDKKELLPIVKLCQAANTFHVSLVSKSGSSRFSIKHLKNGLVQPSILVIVQARCPTVAENRLLKVAILIDV